jgi:hypothetical protein
VNTVQLRRLTPVVAVALALALFATTSGASSAPAALSLAGPTSTDRKVAAYAALARSAAPPGADRILLVGNSVAFNLAPSFQTLSKQLNIAVFNGGVPACGFPSAINYPPIRIPGHPPNPRTSCDPSWESAAVKAFAPNIIFWIYDEIPNSDGTYLGQSVMPCSQTFASVYRKALTDEIGVLRSSGATVVITTSAYSRLFGGISRDDRGDDCENNLKRAIAARTGARLADLFSYICPNGHCRAKQNGVMLRPDGFHYQGPGGEIVARWLYSQVH